MSDYSKEVLAGFVEEAQSYLPIIKEQVGKYQRSRSKKKNELLEEAYRHSHTIKGAAAMIGLSSLSHIAFYLENTLEDVAAGNLDMNVAKPFVMLAVDKIDLYLDGVLDNSVNGEGILIEVTRSYNELRGLPSDDATVEEMIATVSDAPIEPTSEEAYPDMLEISESDAPQQYSETAAMIAFDDEFMAELREAFNEEAEDHLSNISRLLSDLDKTPDDKEQLGELRRIVHTLKGAAATVGISQMTDLSHRMEDLLDHIDEVGASVSRPVMDLMFDSADALTDSLQDVISAERVATLLGRYDKVLVSDGESSELEQSETVDISQYASTPAVEPIVAVESQSAEISAEATAPVPQREEAAPTATRTTSEVVRVPLERLDDLTRLTSEFVITRTTLEQRINDLTRYINEISPSLERLQRISAHLDTDYQEMSYASQNVGFIESMAGTAQAAPLSRVVGSGGGDNGSDLPSSFVPSEFDALEFDRYTELYMLSRELSETTSDIRTTHNDLRSLLGDFDSILTRQGRVSSEVQDKLMRTRMVPLSTIVTRLQRAVRVVARKRNKMADLVIEGEHIELDKKVLEDIADPLLHLLRNSVDHGLEPSDLRQVLGKPERGTIRLRAYYEGNQVIIQVIDDGAGIDANKIRAKALNAGYISETEASEIPDDDLYQLIFMPGFSTADEVTDISGRGVGMDAVKTSVNRLKGTINLSSTQGQGTRFTIRLPLTMAVMRALLVRTHGTEYALPLSAVSQILRIEGSMMNQIGADPVIRIGETVCPIAQLDELLGMTKSDLSERKRIPVLVINTGDRQVAVIVDEIVEGREIVIKTLGNHLRYVNGVTGATLMGDGHVVLILNPQELVSEQDSRQSRQWDAPTMSTSINSGQRILNVLVVDDSVSVRKVVANMVKNAGWSPEMARDGLEALEMIQSGAKLPDAILLDIEMPRMNGYELTATLRAHEQFKDIPIIMLTSRAGDKHRQKAVELGVNEYLVKPYQEDQLLAAVNRVTK